MQSAAEANAQADLVKRTEADPEVSQNVRDIAEALLLHARNAGVPLLESEAARGGAVLIADHLAAVAVGFAHEAKRNLDTPGSRLLELYSTTMLDFILAVRYGVAEVGFQAVDPTGHRGGS